MKLKDYYKHLQKIIDSHPESLEYDVIYSKDDEGNEFRFVGFGPVIGFYDEYGEFYSKESVSESDVEYAEERGYKTILIN